jgi:hypothetical protein
LFNLEAVPLGGGGPISLAADVGMFAYPVVSPAQNLSSGEIAFQIAFLQAIFPRQSDSSPYRLVVMDRDGSNQKVLFPAQGEPGLEPQQVVWSPAGLQNKAGFVVGLLHQGNLWLVNTQSGQAQQVTGDGLSKRLAWR